MAVVKIKYKVRIIGTYKFNTILIDFYIFPHIEDSNSEY